MLISLAKRTLLVGTSAGRVGVVIMFIMYEQRCHVREPPEARASDTVTTGSGYRSFSLARHFHNDARKLTCFAFFPTVFEEKRSHLESMLHTILKLC